ncbi:hypothetical protein EYF80_002193 [Liparis tanakae]|uniref:Uncharacterized protein n=1 Tax=Liparis tanakae TaxID=230148 RepID=A0A4Z2JBA2_9TELE|nr:hypothetical protein EYF80_002193 [Liparis tanakae]
MLTLALQQHAKQCLRLPSIIIAFLNEQQVQSSRSMERLTKGSTPAHMRCAATEEDPRVELRRERFPSPGTDIRQSITSLGLDGAFSPAPSGGSGAYCTHLLNQVPVVVLMDIIIIIKRLCGLIQTRDPDTRYNDCSLEPNWSLSL